MEKDIYSQLINTPTQKEITQDSTTKRKVYLLDFDKHRLSTYKQGVEFYTTNYPVGLHTKVEPMVKEDFEIKYVLVDNWESDIAHRTISEKTLKKLVSHPSEKLAEQLFGKEIGHKDTIFAINYTYWHSDFDDLDLILVERLIIALSSLYKDLHFRILFPQGFDQRQRKYRLDTMKEKSPKLDTSRISDLCRPRRNQSLPGRVYKNKYNEIDRIMNEYGDDSVWGAAILFITQQNIN